MSDLTLNAPGCGFKTLHGVAYTQSPAILCRALSITLKRLPSYTAYVDLLPEMKLKLSRTAQGFGSTCTERNLRVSRLTPSIVADH